MIKRGGRAAGSLFRFNALESQRRLVSKVTAPKSASASLR